ncbi:MAG: hypothetical protein AAF497_28320 [Planctomycetota bacterium]
MTEKEIALHGQGDGSSPTTIHLRPRSSLWLSLTGGVDDLLRSLDH